jgi:hypothetical protein
MQLDDSPAPGFAHLDCLALFCPIQRCLCSIHEGSELGVTDLSRLSVLGNGNHSATIIFQFSCWQPR